MSAGSDLPQTQHYLPQIYKARVPSSLFYTRGIRLIKSCIGRAATKGMGGGYLLASELGETLEIIQSRKPSSDTLVSGLKIPPYSSQIVSFTIPLFLNYNKEELTRTVCTYVSSIQRSFRDSVIKYTCVFPTRPRPPNLPSLTRSIYVEDAGLLLSYPS